MLASSFRFDRPCAFRSTLKSRIAGCLLLLLTLGSAPVWSQPASSTDSMPPWTVLALKLVSTTHVQPTTGIVVAAPDLVLVAVDFAREGDEIMVLDGGTDIVRHGRPATIVHTLPADKLAILKVQGLNRPAASLSALSESELKSLNLVAFPPAEMIAQGSAPVRAAVKTLPAITTTHPTLESFPNVSGALTDACGNLVAFNMSVGVQSMQPTGSPRVAWPDALRRAAKLTGTALATVDCSAGEAQAAEEPAAEPPAAEPAPQPDEETTSPEENNPPAEPAEQDLAASGQDDLQPDVAPEQAEADGELEFDQAVEEPAVETPVAGENAIDEISAEAAALDPVSADADGDLPRRLSPVTMIVAGLFLLLILAWFIRRQRAKASAANSLAGSRSQSDLQTAEPGTVRFAPGDHRAPAVKLQISGQLADGEAFNRLLPVNGPDWFAELGREDADVDLASAAVSRRHARVQIHQGRITVSDLDSTNGTRLNGVSCLPGEVFFVQSGDQLQLGDVTFSLQLTAGSD